MGVNSNEFRSGWKSLLGCIIGVSVSAPSLYIYTGGIWITSWQEEFGWSRGEIGLGQSLAMIIVILGTPFAGMLIDRFGFKKVGIISLVSYSSCFLLFSQMNGSLIVFYLISMLMGVASLPSNPVGFTKVINNWFSENRGLALGITLSAIGLGAIIIPKYLVPFVALNGWRIGQIGLFLIVLAAIPLVAFLLQEKPAEIPDANPNESEKGMSLKTAIKTPVFWKVGLLFLLLTMALTGFIPSLIPLLQDEGMSFSEAGKYAALLGLSVVVSRVVTGFLIDRFFAPYIIIGAMFLCAAGCLLLGIGGVQFIAFAVISIGLVLGAEMDLISYLTARYFGHKHYSAIYGSLFSLFSIGGAISPFLIGYTWDATGSYSFALFLAVSLILVSIVIAFSLPRFSTKAFYAS